MIQIPFTQAAILSGNERRQISEALEMGAKTLMKFTVEQAQLLAVIEQQAQACDMLMAIQHRIADAINASVAEGASAEDLAHNLTTILGEYAA